MVGRFLIGLSVVALSLAQTAEQKPAGLPPEVPKVLNGFSGDKYVIAGDELVIVDQHSLRVAAFIGGVK